MKPIRAAILARAVALLAAGLLSSALPAALMAEFNLTPAAARKLAGEAVKRRRIEMRTNEKPGS